MTEDTTGDPSVTITPTTLTPGGSQVHVVIEVETSPSYAGDTVTISSTQLQLACGGAILFETLQGGSTVAPTTSLNSISVLLDDDGNVTVVVDGYNCASGTDLIEADMAKAPYLTATTTLDVDPPQQVTPSGLSATPANEVETGDSPTTGESDVYTVFYVESDPVYAEQPVEISSNQLENRCALGWLWEPGSGTAINQTSGPTTATGTLDDDGNATFVFKGASCAPGTSTITATVEAGTRPTYTTTYTIAAPAVTLATHRMAATTKKPAKAPAKSRRRHHHPKGTAPAPDPPAMTVTASPNPLIESGSGETIPAATSQCVASQPRGALLSDGCVVYAVTTDPENLDLEFVRGPDVGQTIVIGPITGATSQLTDIALTSSGVLYATDFSNFYTLDPNTGAATDIGATGALINGLVVGPTGTIYGSGLDDDLYTIDPTTGLASEVGNTGFNPSGDLAFSANGNLYMTAVDISSDDLVSLDPTTGAGTLIGPIGQSEVYGMASSYGTLFGATSGGDLLTINTTTGAGTVIATGGPSVYGFASSADQT
jgi:hypothetical protein